VDDADTTVSVRNVKNGSLESQLNLRPWNSCQPAHCASKGLLAIAGDDRAIHLFRCKDWTLRNRLEVPAPPHIMSFSRDGRFLAGGCEQGKVWIYDLISYECRELPLPPHNWHRTLQFSPTEDLLAVGTCGGRSLTCLKTPSFEQVKTLQTPSIINFVQFLPDGSELAVGEADDVSLWDMPELQPIGMFRGHSVQAQRVAFSPNGQTAASIGHDGVRV